MWEIFTLGGSPYPGLPTEDLFGFLEAGRRMEQPDACPLEFFAIMNDCWEKNPNDRPLFSQLVDRIAQIIANRSGEVDIVFSCYRLIMFMLLFLFIYFFAHPFSLP